MASAQGAVCPSRNSVAPVDAVEIGVTNIYLPALPPRTVYLPSTGALAAPPAGSSAPGHPVPLGTSCKSLAAGSCLVSLSFCLSLSLFLALFRSCYEETKEGLSFSHPLKCLRLEGIKFPSPSFEFS